jgi:hypothetical protein
VEKVKIEKAKAKDSEVLMSDKIQWCGFSELLDLCQESGDIQTNFNDSKQDIVTVDLNPKPLSRKEEKP